jgi:hypothetical protein
MGMIGAAMLYAAMPPVNADGTFNKREFVVRLACAGVFSAVFGQWAVDMLMQHAASLQADKHSAAVYLLTGAPGWWLSRGAALWLHRRRDKDLGQVYDELKN